MSRHFILFLLLLASLGALYHRSTSQEKDWLKITLVDSQTKRPVSGLIRCLTQSGNQAVPVGGALARGQGLEGKDTIPDWYVITESAEILLPRQPLKLEAFAGLETELASASIDLSGRDQESLTIPLRSFSQVSRQGWYGGNTHLHLSNLNKDQADRYLREIPRADHLDVLFISYLERAVVDKDYITNLYPLGDLKQFWSTGVLVNNGEEHRHNFGDQGEGFGHVMLLNIRNLVQPVSIGPGISHQGTDGTALQSGIDAAHRQGGVAIWCHNNWGMEDVPNFVSRKLEAQNIFDGGTHGSYEDSFYHYLNAGIRVPFSTGTDWFMYDLARVYTKVAGDLGIKSWLDALVAGRSFISNGPLFELTVGGQEVGDTVNLKSGREVQVKGKAIGRVNFEKVQLIENGKVIAEVDPRSSEGHFEARLDRGVEIDEPAWLALRISTKANNEFGRQLFGHTSPIYITVDGKSIRMKDEIEYLMKQMEDARQTVATQSLFATKEERERVLSIYTRGMETLRGPGASLR